jgi:hypothetical protein
VTNTLDAMPKPPKKGKDAKPGKYPSREKVTYTAIPREYGELLKELTADGEKHQGRSVSFLTKLAVQAFLKAEGKLDEKGKPLPPT